MANTITEQFLEVYKVKPDKKVTKSINKVKTTYNFYTLDTKLIYKLIAILEEKEINIDSVREAVLGLCINNSEKIKDKVTKVLKSRGQCHENGCRKDVPNVPTQT